MNPLEARLDRVEAQLAIGQLPIRYAMAVDARDIDAWLECFIPDVQVGRDRFGREALREYIVPVLRRFRSSMHQIVGHRVVVDGSDNATGATYCRAEHEVDDRWVIVDICYFDEYQRVDGEWFFRRRKERHWYAADINEHPQAVGFDSWNAGGPPTLPEAFPTWEKFWQE
jgi:hypothetical protein